MDSKLKSPFPISLYLMFSIKASQNMNENIKRRFHFNQTNTFQVCEKLMGISAFELEKLRGKMATDQNLKSKVNSVSIIYSLSSPS